MLSKKVISCLLMVSMARSGRAFVGPTTTQRVSPTRVLSKNDDLDTKSTTDPVPIVTKTFKEHGKNIAAATAAAGLAIMLNSAPADAAMSGGRMGGSFSAPRSSSTTRMAPSSSYSRGYSGGYSSGYRGGYYSRGPTVVAPIITPFAPIAPIAPIVPYGGGVGAITYSRGPGLFDLLFLGGLGWFAISTVSNMLSGPSRFMEDRWSESSVFSNPASSALGTGTSVMKLSIALDVPNRDDPYSILSVLDRLAANAKTDTRKGVQQLTSQVAVELLRRKSSIQSATSEYKHTKDDRNAERTFQNWSINERSKFEKETISKFGGIDTSMLSRRIRGKDDDNSGKATMAVVTLVLSIQGDTTKIPKINTLSDVETALHKIAADVKVDDCLLSAEILWTPEDRNEVLSRQDIIADYPELRSV